MDERWARFWAVDLHVHTPGSSDAEDDDFGEPADIVAAATAAGLDCIAVTDHNTASWCDRMADVASGTALVVLPGVELSTREGHLLGVWEEGTPAATIEEVLVRVGIPGRAFGMLDVVADRSMLECADEIRRTGGIAIPAHVEKDRGIMVQPVQVHVNALLGDRRFHALEHVHPDTPRKVAAKLAGDHAPAMIQSSDAFDASLSRHSASGIGVRRTWIKAARPDLRGIAHALEDPTLRVRLEDPSTAQAHPTIKSVSIDGGFLGGSHLELSPDLTCLLGGTGAGKSLLIEAIRYALEQQVPLSFGAIRNEVDRRLQLALRPGTEVAVEVAVGDDRYRIRRVFGSDESARVDQESEGEWVRITRRPESLVVVSAFSQGEILEYARQPVGRIGLVDAHLDLSGQEAEITRIEHELTRNAEELICARTTVEDLQQKASTMPVIEERERELSALFDGDLVKSQRRWTAERSALSSLGRQLAELSFSLPSVPSGVNPAVRPEHDALFQRIQDARDALEQTIADAAAAVDAGLVGFRRIVDDVHAEWERDFAVQKAEFDRALQQSGNATLPALRRELESTQASLSSSKAAIEELDARARPRLAARMSERESLLTDLKRLRDERRALRRRRATDLNRLTAGFVRMDVPARGDTRAYRDALDVLKVGSRLREQTLDSIAAGVHPYPLARALWSGDFSRLTDLPDGVTVTDLSRLHTNIADRDLWRQLLELQAVETPDVLDLRFRRPEERDYTAIEDLSHGQKCTAILVVLLADGESPVLVDQPEDALHAPWIEEYLVDRLRELRGTRQYIFATRSPGLVVSADAEYLVTMRATAGAGEIEASGSLERYDLNALALHHLEGGPVPFSRRTKKLSASLAS